MVYEMSVRWICLIARLTSDFDPNENVMVHWTMLSFCGLIYFQMFLRCYSINYMYMHDMYRITIFGILLDIHKLVFMVWMLRMLSLFHRQYKSLNFGYHGYGMSVCRVYIICLAWLIWLQLHFQRLMKIESLCDTCTCSKTFIHVGKAEMTFQHLHSHSCLHLTPVIMSTSWLYTCSCFLITKVWQLLTIVIIHLIILGIV